MTFDGLAAFDGGTGAMFATGAAPLAAPLAPPAAPPPVPTAVPAPPIVIRSYLAAVPDQPTDDSPDDETDDDRVVVLPDVVAPAVDEHGPVRIDRRRDDDPMAELFTAHYARLAGWCSRLVDDEQLAHEIASEAFTRLLSKWRGVDDVRGYLYVTASNLVKDHWRRLERERRAMTKVEVQTSAPGADEAPPLRDVVERLPHRHRDVVLLHYYADISVRDTARALKVSEGAVKRRLFEARALLLEALEGHR